MIIIKNINNNNNNNNNDNNNNIHNNNNNNDDIHNNNNNNNNNDLMVADLTDARLATVTRREWLYELEGLESLLNPCARLDTRLYPGLDLRLDPGERFSLECECNVPNCRQGIISMLRVGRWADFASRAEAKGRKWRPRSGA